MNPFSESRFPTIGLRKVAQIQLGKMLQPQPIGAHDEYMPYLRAGSLANLDGKSLSMMWGSRSDKLTYGVVAGDILVAEGGDVGRAEFAPVVPPGTIIQNSLHRVRSEGGDSRFLRYCLHSIHQSAWLEVICNKSTFGHLTLEKISSIKVPQPGLSTQRAVADFLDAETAGIDSLVLSRARQVDLVAEHFRSLVSETVTLGGPRPLRRHLVLLTSGPRGWADLITDDGDLFIRSANLQRDAIDLDLTEIQCVSPQLSPEATRSRVAAGDVLVGITGANCGWAAVADEHAVGGYVSQHVAIMRFKGVDPVWMAYCVFSTQGQQALFAGQYGGTKQQLGLEDLARLSVCVPTSDEQRAGAARLDARRRRSEATVRDMRKQIALLQERKQALTIAAVTGQLNLARDIAEEVS